VRCRNQRASSIDTRSEFAPQHANVKKYSPCIFRRSTKRRWEVSFKSQLLYHEAQNLHSPLGRGLDEFQGRPGCRSKNLLCLSSGRYCAQTHVQSLYNLVIHCNIIYTTAIHSKPCIIYHVYITKYLNKQMQGFSLRNGSYRLIKPHIVTKYVGSSLDRYTYSRDRGFQSRFVDRLL
jgi:hypothetical protein